MRSGMIVVAAVAPFFLFPVLGMLFGRAVGGLAIFGGIVAGLVLAAIVGRLLGRVVAGRE